MLSQGVDREAVMARRKRKSNPERYVGLYHYELECPAYLHLSVYGRALLIEFRRLYNGYNNGDLSATWTQAKGKWFKSPSTLFEARKELLHYRLVKISRRGGTNKPTLYAITWWQIDDCKGKLDIRKTLVPPGSWQKKRPDYVTKAKREKARKIKRNCHMRTKSIHIATNLVPIGIKKAKK